MSGCTLSCKMEVTQTSTEGLTSRVWRQNVALSETQGGISAKVGTCVNTKSPLNSPAVLEIEFHFIDKETEAQRSTCLFKNTLSQ